MGWSLGYDEHWSRDIGYGVPTICDHPDCSEKIDRGLAYVCANEEPRGGEGCGLYFCSKHKGFYGDPDNDDENIIADCCERCRDGLEPFPPKSDTEEWNTFKMNDESWAEWRKENHEFVEANKHLVGRDVEEMDGLDIETGIGYGKSAK